MFPVAVLMDEVPSNAMLFATPPVPGRDSIGGREIVTRLKSDRPIVGITMERPLFKVMLPPASNVSWPLVLPVLPLKSHVVPEFRVIVPDASKRISAMTFANALVAVDINCAGTPGAVDDAARSRRS